MTRARTDQPFITFAQRETVKIMRVISVIVLSFTLFGAQAHGQTILQVSPRSVSTSIPSVEIPRQLSLEKAEEILLQKNLTLTAARYGVDVARAQRLIAGVRPNPTITLAAEQFDLAHPFQHLVTTDPNSAANRVYTFRYDQILERGNKRQLRTAVAE